MRSLRAQLLVWMIGLLTAVGILGSAAAYMIALHEPDGFLDDQLRQVAIHAGHPGEASASEVVPNAGFAADLDPEDVIVVSKWDHNDVPIDQVVGPVNVPRHTTTGYSNDVVEGTVWRTYTLVGPLETVAVSQRLDVRQELATASALNAVVPLLLLVPLSWLVVGLAIGRMLAPMQELAQSIKKRAATSDTPLPLVNLPSEVVPLVTSVNELLARQHELLEHRQRFIADAAHQLRTPLTALRLQANNLRSALLPVPPAAIGDMERGIERLSRMVGQLLHLARADAPGLPASMTLQDFTDIVREALADVLPQAAEKCIDIGMTESACAPIRAEHEDIRALVMNLIDNAVRYTPTHGKVDVSVIVRDGMAVLTIIDNGPGIPEAVHDRVFDRFFRVAGNPSDGSGLGLAIVAAIALHHGGTAAIANRRGQPGLVATVQLPVAATPIVGRHDDHR